MDTAVIDRPRVKRLNEKAIQVQLATSRARLSKRDVAAEKYVQDALGDESLTTYSQLFRNKHNPVNKLMTEANKVYAGHIEDTLATQVKGTRLLPMKIYDEYRLKFKKLVGNVDAMKQTVMPIYDQCVQQDIAERSAAALLRGIAQRASVDDYPSAAEFNSKLTFNLRLIPLPDASHFLFDIDDADLQAFNDSLADIEAVARANTLKIMLEPLKHLVAKLSLPIGTDGATFRDSAIENVIEGVENAKRLCIDDSPEIQGVINALDTEIKRYTHEWLRESPVMREQAQVKLNDIASQMAGFM